MGKRQTWSDYQNPDDPIPREQGIASILWWMNFREAEKPVFSAICSADRSIVIESGDLRITQTAKVCVTSTGSVSKCLNPDSM
jgi:hypothetical protein